MNVTRTLLTMAAAALFATAIQAGSPEASIHESPSATLPYKEIREHASKIQLEAQEISTMLKSKQPNYQSISDKVGALEKHVEKVTGLVDHVEKSHSNLSGDDEAELKKLKAASQTLAIFTTNKKEMLNSSDVAKNRNLLRAKAEGIAVRAGKLEKSAARLEGSSAAAVTRS